MRLQAAALLCLVVAAGCATPVADLGGSERPALGHIETPEGATVAPLPEGAGSALSFGDVALPFAGNFTLPTGATVVRLVADPGPGNAVSVGMASEQTGRRRCNQPTVSGFDQPILGAKSCSYLAGIDPPGSSWRFAVAGASRAAVRVEFLSTPLDGLVAGLDLSQLSMPTFRLKPTQTLFVPSFDGAKLRVEVTLPDGPGPWPTVIESSPYHDDGLRLAPASWNYFVHDWATRGYAVVVADVRGFGDSGGCVEVWGPDEQQDQAFLVEWAAKQSWSDGHVGFYGQSYVGTTPVEAAVLAPPHLDAIVTVAPVVKNYDDWHFGGVPNGENVFSPIDYEYGTDAETGGPYGAALGLLLGGQLPDVSDPAAPPAPRGDPQQQATQVTNGFCDPADILRPNDPRALYDQYYIDRDFAAKAANVKAAVLYTHGFEDANVKAQMIPDWFNAIRAPKLGLFGHWLHQHPPRMDQEVLFLGWMDQYVKGKPLGFEKLPKAEIVIDGEHVRDTDRWPTPGITNATYYLDFSARRLSPGDVPPSSDAISLMPRQVWDTPLQVGPIHLLGNVTTDAVLTGNAVLHIKGNLRGLNGYIGAYLYESACAGVPPTSQRLLTWGWFNLAHRNGHDRYDPVVDADMFPIEADLQFRPTEHLLHAGCGLELVLEGAQAPEETLDPAGLVGESFRFWSGETQLHLPLLPLAAATTIPITATP